MSFWVAKPNGGAARSMSDGRADDADTVAMNAHGAGSRATPGQSGAAS